VTEALVIKSKAETTRQNDTSIPTLQTAVHEKRSFGGKVGGFFGGKMFDYFLTRLRFIILYIYYFKLIKICS
jgi:hypothetical protein